MQKSYSYREPPLGKLIWSPANGNFQQSQLRLAYRFEVYSLNPFRRTINYIDALNGQLLWQEEGIHHIDSLGMAETAFSGARKIMTHYEDNRFRLADFTRGKGIVTLNAKNKFFWQVVGEDFWDEDNLWHNINLQRDEYATDAHWGTAQTYDFLSQVLGRNSIDDEGFLLISHIHVGENFRNAFWDGRGMYYGDGDSIGGTVDPLVSLDIVAHEIAHGLTQFTASLIYSNESGALNESFSDIMGKVVQRWSKPQSFDWIMGNEANFPIRNMSQPNDYNHPNTYQGNHWAVPGRVHTNSGVQNYWFYLLSEGGAGTNDNGDDFNLSGLGIDKATQIAFRSLIYYLHPSSTYEEARLYSVQAASDLYGACSPEVEQVIRAWYAVGVGPDYSLPVAEADFSLSNSTLCSPDREVQFTNLSRNGSSYRWDFGDGNSSEEFAPAHTYTEIGLYTVSLQLEGACGNDEKIINQAVEVLAIPAGPVISSLNNKPICGEEMALLAQ
ncbi:MAG: M4 family metallopeptidase [Bacteroidota bacterium]